MGINDTILSLRPGDRLCGRYELVHILGRGGMSEVWLARDHRLDGRPVALKVLPAALSTDKRAVARLKEEASRNLELTHPHIVRLHTFDQDPTRQDVAFLVMQYIEGQTLNDLLASHPKGMPVEMIRPWFEQVAQAIDYAHERGILHRDIKPGNIIIEAKTNAAYLMDFGIGREARDTMTRMTGVQDVDAQDSSGTLPYMSPQQLKRRNDKSNDIYSFAATLYEAIAGLPPFHSGDIANQIHNVAPEPIAHAPAFFNDILLRGLAKDPSARPQRCRDMLPHHGGGNQPTPVSFPDKGAATVTKYHAGRIALPFKAVSIRMLHDGVTAAVGGADGQLAAIDLRTGETVDTVHAEDASSRSSRVGGGENHYRGDAFFFLERASYHNRFYTMSHSAILKTWTIVDGKLLKLHEADLITPHFDRLHDAIATASGRFGWSSWSCYNRDIPSCAPSGIVDAKITPNGRAVLCLTDWFAVYRCDLSGRLLDGPLVVSDTFDIEPATPDGRGFYAGRSTSQALTRGNGDFVQHLAFDGGDVQASAAKFGSVGYRGIHAISDTLLCVDGALRLRPSLEDFGSKRISLGIGCRPTVHRQAGLVAAPIGSIIRLYNTNTGVEEGEPLLAGHEGDVLDLDVSNDASTLVSISESSLRIWDLSLRRAVGDRESGEPVARHGEHLRGPALYSSGKLLCPAYSGKSVVVNIESRSCEVISSNGDPLGGTVDHAGRIHYICLGHRRFEETAPRRGLLARFFGPLTRSVSVVSLQHYTIIDGRESLVHETELCRSGSYLHDCFPRHGNSMAVDLGHGRVAVLLAGHVLVYDVGSASIVEGPLDISGPGERGDYEDREWTFYAQIARSVRGDRLFVRGTGREVLALSVPALKVVGRVPESEGELGVLLGLDDSRYCLFSKTFKVKTGRLHEERTLLLLGDTERGTVVGACGQLRYAGYYQNPCYYALTPDRSTLIACQGRDVEAVRFASDDTTKVVAHADLVYACAFSGDGKTLCTVASDGTARFTPFVAPDSGVADILNCVRPLSEMQIIE